MWVFFFSLRLWYYYNISPFPSIPPNPLNITFSVHRILLLYIFSGLTIFGTGQIISVFVLRKTTSLSPSFYQLPIVLCIGLRPCGQFPIQFSISVGVILVQPMFRQLYWCGLIGVTSDVTRRHNCTLYSMILWLFHNVPWALSVGLFCEYIHADGVSQLILTCGFL